MRQSSHQPSDPAYHIEDCWIFRHAGMNLTTMITATSKHAELKPPPTTERNSAHNITVSVLAMNTHNFAACAALLC